MNLLYALLKLPAKIAIWFYCRNIAINKKELLQSEGPLLIAANHPNSFLDAIIIATLFKKPVYSLARGDAFSNNFYSKILRALNILPVYRISEGAQNLEHNYKTFSDCIEIFKKNGVVLIFSEGRCINEWHLRPLKKGTARLVFSSWDSGIPLKILPLGINYSSFQKFGKNMQLNFGEMISVDNFKYSAISFGKDIANFNEKLNGELSQLVLEIDKNDTEIIQKKFASPITNTRKKILTFPGLIGYATHLPLYYPVKKIAAKTTNENDHFDSVVVGLLFLAYPLYLFLIAFIIGYFIGGWWWLSVFIAMPFLAWSYLQIKRN
ncbi:MAG: 1-acyl-sn-glycerol-3-phosphate acyltransferase [Bacteroidota bacterium]